MDSDVIEISFEVYSRVLIEEGYDAAKHHTENFEEKFGLRFISSYIKKEHQKHKFVVIDRELYFLAKIKHGF